MNGYYVMTNGSSWFVKTEEYFREQGGLTDDWGKKWIYLRADSIEHARTLAELKRLKGEI